MLILAAIDMLTASLVCAVVLFLLVGGQSDEAAATPGAEMLNAPSIAPVYFKGPVWTGVPKCTGTGVGEHEPC